MSDEAETRSLMISGMTCSSCVRAVKRVLAEAGAPHADVDLATGRADVSADTDLDAAIEALGDAGYRASPAP